MDRTEHCPGCRGYTRDLVRECPGLPQAQSRGQASFHQAVTQDVVPKLGWRDRLKVLIGTPVIVRVRYEASGGGGGGGGGGGSRIGWHGPVARPGMPPPSQGRMRGIDF